MRVVVTNFNESKQIRVKSTTTGNTTNTKKHFKKANNNKPNDHITEPGKLPKGDVKGHIRYDKDQKGRQVEINFLISYPKAIWMQLTPEQRKLIASKSREHKRTARSIGQADTTGDNITHAASISSLQAQISTLNSQIQSLTSGKTDDVSVLTTSLIGGRTAAGQNKHNINTVRVISSVHHNDKPNAQHSVPHTMSYNETDSNADTCCLGNNFAVLQYTNRSATVAPFHADYAALTNVPIVTGATVYDDPYTNTSILLIINEGLYFGSTLDHSLINPNQIRHYGHTYQDNPYSSDPLGIVADNNHISLHSSGTKIQFNTRCPTDTEIRTLPSIQLTSDHEWIPQHVTLGEVKFSSPTSKGENYTVEQLYDDLPMARKIASLTMLDLPDAPPPLGLDRKANKYSDTRADILAGRWWIGRKWAEATLKKTSQKYF
jgi:hypothetical protein